MSIKRITEEQSEWTMRDVVRILGVPKHRIIYFCNAGVVQPHINAAGRGKVRRFSTKNFFEFQLALSLQNAGVPGDYSGKIILLLEKFEKQLSKKLPQFTIPSGIADSAAPEFRAVIGDGRNLSFVLVMPKGKMMVTSAVDLLTKSATKQKIGDLKVYSKSGMFSSHTKNNQAFGYPEGSDLVRTEISFTNMARYLLQKIKEDLIQQ